MYNLTDCLIGEIHLPIVYLMAKLDRPTLAMSSSVHAMHLKPNTQEPTATQLHVPTHITPPHPHPIHSYTLHTPYTINNNDMLSYSLTSMMCFLTKEWYGFPVQTVNLFIKAYHRITYKEDLKSHKGAVSLRWYAFLCGFVSDVLFTIEHLRSISFFCQNVHHDSLTKEYISNWFLVIHFPRKDIICFYVMKYIGYESRTNDALLVLNNVIIIFANHIMLEYFLLFINCCYSYALKNKQRNKTKQKQKQNKKKYLFFLLQSYNTNASDSYNHQTLIIY